VGGLFAAGGVISGEHKHFADGDFLKQKLYWLMSPWGKAVNLQSRNTHAKVLVDKMTHE
jgi:hypothetical protein